MPVRPVSAPATLKWIAGCLCLSALALSACSTDFKPGDARAQQSILIEKGARTLEARAFSPNPVTVISRTMVVWTNRDTTSHRIASTSGLFMGPVIRPGETYSFLFTTPNTYMYYCMSPGHTETGRIIVTP